MFPTYVNTKNKKEKSIYKIILNIKFIFKYVKVILGVGAFVKLLFSNKFMILFEFNQLKFKIPFILKRSNIIIINIISFI